jgi:hypothetical protein
MTPIIVARQAITEAKVRARKRGWGYIVSDSWVLPATKTLFIDPSVAIPWDLIGAGWGFLDRWDVAAPLWRYGVLALNLGGPSERERTEKICLDLRQLVYAHELLFVKDSLDGQRFLATWLAECEGGGDKRLAFLRALHIVKPIFCALPRSWLLEIPGSVAVKMAKVTSIGIVKVEVAPGRFVTCRPGEEERVRQQFSRLALPRSARRSA